jgi:PhoH-like ATPase
MHLSERHPGREVILVSKDINMRIKAARSACWRRITSTTRCSKTPTCSTPARASCRKSSGTKHGGNLESWKENGRTFVPGQGPLCPDLLINEFVYRETGAKQDKPFQRHGQGSARARRRCSRP